MTATIKILGVTDERTECECCGRSGLKRTVALSIADKNDSRVVYYGTDCAHRSLGVSKKTVAEALEASELVAKLTRGIATLRTRQDATSLATRALRGAMFNALESVKAIDWNSSADRNATMRTAYAVLQSAERLTMAGGAL